MKKIISKAILFSVLLFSVLSHEDIEFDKLGDIATLEFPPNQPYAITNPLLWKVKVSCRVETPDDSDLMYAKIKKGSASVNGQDIKGELTVEVKNGDTLVITASALGSFEITNLGQNTVVTPCGLSYETLSELEYMRSILIGEEDEYLNFLA